MGIGKNEIKEIIAEIEERIKTLEILTLQTRSVFCTMVERSDPSLNFLITEVRDVLELSDYQLHNHFNVLLKYNLIDDVEHLEGGIFSNINESEISIWNDIRTYCDKSSIELSSIINDLKFNLLD